MKIFYTVAGSISLALGMAGIFLPLLPTTPFLLVTAWMYCKSSPRLYGWLMSHPYCGPYIRNYRDHRSITLGCKITSLILLWSTISVCIIFIVRPLWIKWVLAGVIAGVTWHILSFRTMKADENVKLIPVRKSAHLLRLQNLAVNSGSEIRSAEVYHATETTACKISEKEEVYLIHAGGRDRGYLRMVPHGTFLELTGLYISEADRGKGYAREALTFLEHYCAYRNIGKITVRIAKADGRGVAVYVKSGFMITDTGSIFSSESVPPEHYVLERDIL